MKTRLSARTSLVIIASLFTLPLILAWLMYSGAIDYRPASTRNFGQLVEPPLPMAWETTELVPNIGEPETDANKVFTGHWVVLYVVPEPCHEDCVREVSNLRQIHRAAGRHQSRIRIALLLHDPSPPEVETTLRHTYSEFHLVSDPSGALGRVLQLAARDEGSAYLIDPLGNIMMAYATGTDPNHLRQDLKRLLTWSKLDEQ